MALCFLHKFHKKTGRKELLAVGQAAGLEKDKCVAMIEKVEKNVTEMLGEYIG
jgi:hypothetical protein